MRACIRVRIFRRDPMEKEIYPAAILRRFLAPDSPLLSFWSLS